MFIVFLSALGMGLALYAAPGMINLETLRRGIGFGFHAAWQLQLGALAGNCLWILLAFGGVSFLSIYPSTQIAIQVLGAAVLLYLAWASFKDRRAGVQRCSSSSPRRNCYIAGFMLSVFNPLIAVFWIGAAQMLLSAGAPAGRHLAFATFIAGVMLAHLAWSLGFARICSWGRRYDNPSLIYWSNTACGLLLGCFGLQMLVATFGLI